MFELNEKQKLAFNKVLEGKNLFISGSGGVGKSFLIRYIMEKFEDSTVLLAPTGIAALNIGGSTIHRSFGFRTSILSKFDWTHSRDSTKELYNTDSPVKRIIIDEISMNRGDVFRAIDQSLRYIRKKNKPFGGLQIIVVGDFFQLPPVLTDNDLKEYKAAFSSVFAFGDGTWANSDFEYVELDQVMRQSDEIFINHLQNVRRGLPGLKDSIDFFNKIGKGNNDKLFEDDPLFLCTVNARVDQINSQRFEEIDEPSRKFKAIVDYGFKEEPVPRELELKYGTKVMFAANTDLFKNGEVGYVTGFIDLPNETLIEVTKDNHSEDVIHVPQYTWTSFDYEISADETKLKKRKIGSFTQYPLKWAWAVTIHKSQGLTLDSAVIDFGRRCFASGQAYIALSRLKTLDGLGLLRPMTEKDVIVNSEVKKFYDSGCRGIGVF